MPVLHSPVTGAAVAITLAVSDTVRAAWFRARSGAWLSGRKALCTCLNLCEFERLGGGVPLVRLRVLQGIGDLLGTGSGARDAVSCRVRTLFSGTEWT